MELPNESVETTLPSSQSQDASVLVLAPCLHDDADAVCSDLLDPVPDEFRALVVDVTASPLRVRRRLAEAVDDEPAALEVVGVEYMRPAEQAPADADGATTIPDADTTYVQAPGDLSGLGVAASSTLREWADVDEQVVVCLRSLTTILQYADDGPTLAFLQEFLNHCATADAFVHVHLDPTAVDDRTVEGVRRQVETVVELEPR